MPDLQPLLDLLPRLLPFDALNARFMQRALLALLLLAPMGAAMGVQVVTFRMAFFSDAISHSAFAGVAIGLLLSLDPRFTMPAFGLLVAVGIMTLQRRSALSSDTVIGVFFSAVIAFGLAVISRDRSISRDVQRFVYGDVLTIGAGDLWVLLFMFCGVAVYQAWAYNRMMLVGVNPIVAEVHGVRVAVFQYAFAALIALVVMFSVWAVGVFLVTAMLIVPATAARSLSKTAGGMFWWALIVSVTSACAGLLISAQDWARTAAGATVVLVSLGWFVISQIVAAVRGVRRA